MSISVSDVKQMLGESSNSVGKLCVSANINKWSKRKPVEINAPVVDRNKEWWRGDDLTCGIALPLFDSLSALVAWRVNGTGAPVNGWNYQRDDAGYQRPKRYYRLGDFIGYFHEAGAPVLGMQGDSKNQGVRGGMSELQFFFDKQTDERALQLGDLVITYADSSMAAAAKNMNVGLCLYNDTTKLIVPASTAGSGASVLKFTLSNPSSFVGMFNAFLFLSSVAVTQTTSPQTTKGVFTFLPFAMEKEVKIYNEVASLTFSLWQPRKWMDGAVRNTYYGFSITNNENYDVTIQRVNWTRYLSTGNESGFIEDVHIAAKSTYQYGGTNTVSAAVYAAFTGYSAGFEHDGISRSDKKDVIVGTPPRAIDGGELISE